jgi:predicted nucleic acid-binding protein
MYLPGMIITCMETGMRIFVDTSAWYALNDRKDQNHKKAGKFIESLKAEPVLLFTTDYVVDETLTLLRFRVSHRAAASFLRLFSQSQQIVREQATSDQLTRAEEIFLQYKDKLWSFTDCVSFAFMEEKRLKDAFTFDAHFNQFGMHVYPDPN